MASADDRGLDEERSDERRLFAPRFTDFVILNVHEDIGAGLKVRQNIGAGIEIKGAGHAASLFSRLSRGHWLGRVFVRANLGGERIKPNPTDFKNSAAGAGLAATCRRQPRLPDWLGARQ